MLFSSIWPIDKTLSGDTTPGQSWPGSDGNEGVLHISQSFSIFTIRLYSVLSRTLFRRVFSFCWDAVGAFCSPSWLGWFKWKIKNNSKKPLSCQKNSTPPKKNNQINTNVTQSDNSGIFPIVQGYFMVGAAHESKLMHGWYKEYLTMSTFPYRGVSDAEQ